MATTVIKPFVEGNMSMPGKTEWATIGRIVAPFGIRGELKVFSLSDIPNRFAKLDVIYLGSDYVPHTITAVRPYKGDLVILKLSDIDDATTADTLRNFDLSIPLDKLAQLPHDSYYQHDIIGMHVLTLSGREVGIIVDILVTGSNDVYIVKDSEERQTLLPAIKEVIKQVDLIRHIMYIDPIAGLLDDNAVIDEQNETLEEEGE